MALTLSGFGNEVITNEPVAYSVTSLVEGASYQNLRIRATIYIGGVADAVAVLEQPKGINTWNFNDVLKSFTGKCDTAVGGITHHTEPGYTGELLTGWTNYVGSFNTTFTSSGRAITSAVSTQPGVAMSNDIGSAVAGNVYVVCCEDGFTDTGANKFYFKLWNTTAGNLQSEIKYAGLTVGKMGNNHVYFLMCHDTISNPAIGAVTDGAANGSLTSFCRKIIDFRNNPGVYYHIKFEEVYENASDVTTIGAEEWSDTMLFIPAKVRPGEDFETDFLSVISQGGFLGRADDAGLYKYGIEMEYRTMVATTAPYLRAQVVDDAGSESDDYIPNMGWMIMIVSDISTPTYPIDAEDETVLIRVYSQINGGGALFTVAVATIECEMVCYQDIKALSFVGDLGEETALFRGLHTEVGEARKSYYRTINRVRKVLKAFRYVRMKLRGLVETEAARKVMHELVYTEAEVWMYDSDETAGYKVVTVVDDEVMIGDRNELFESSIDIEYYE